jgi:hypothetical protein
MAKKSEVAQKDTKEVAQSAQKDMEAMEQYVAQVGGKLANFMMNNAHLYPSEEDFKYTFHRNYLRSEMALEGDYPKWDVRTQEDYDAVEQQFLKYMSQEPTTISDIFEGCMSIRDKIGRIAHLTERELTIVSDNAQVEFSVRQASKSILNGNIDAVYKLLDQGFGKPVERQEVITADVSAVKKLTTAELKALAAGSDEDV